MAYEIPILSVPAFQSTGAIIAFRVVKHNGTGLVHTTGSSGRKCLGVAQQGSTAASRSIQVMVYGVTKVEASSNAIAIGASLRPTSGAAASTSRLGGTVRSTTNNTQNVIGMALTSAAAGTGRRFISMLLTHAGRCSTAA